MSTINLYEETLSALKKANKSPEDVRWVGNKLAYISWQEFAELSQKISYDNGYGLNEIDEKLVVVGDNWWLSRGEYDGSEWWDFNTQPAQPDLNRKIEIKSKYYY